MKGIKTVLATSVLIFSVFTAGCIQASQVTCPSLETTNNTPKTYSSTMYGLSFQYPGDWSLQANETVVETTKTLRLEYANSSSGLSFSITGYQAQIPPTEPYVERDSCGGGWTDDRPNLTVLESYHNITIGDGVRARRFIFLVDGSEQEKIETTYELCKTYKSGTWIHLNVFWSVPSDNFFSTRPEIQEVLDSITLHLT